MASSSSYQTEIVRTAKSAEALRDAWKSMPSRLDADLDYFLEFAQAYCSFVSRLHIIVLRREGRIVAILPGRVERRSLKVRIGYRNFTLPMVNQLTFVGQLLGQDDQETADQVMKSIQDSLRQKEGEVALFHQVDSEDSLCKAMNVSGNVFTKDYFPESGENWRSQIPTNYETFLKSRSGNTRHNIKRYSKRLLEAFPGKLEYKVFRELSDVDLACRDCEVIAAKSYHRGLGVGFVNDQATRRLFNFGASQGWLRSYILYVDGRPSAFWNGFLHQGTFWARDTAFDAEISELRPGLYLLMRLVEGLCAEGSVQELDFGTGSAQYKRDMCDTVRVRISKLIFAPTLKGVSINGLRTPPMAVSETAKWVLTRSGVFEKVRKAWRSHIAATVADETSKETKPFASKTKTELTTAQNRKG